ncbi:MAG: crosslink repair DNA glycosylase YcaQ family protein [Acidobacteriota bacterium]
MDENKLRAWWFQRQGLDGSLVGASSADVLERSGWSRSVGGVGPYLTLFSRAGTARTEADKAVAKLQIHELPAARGCTYVVPKSDFTLALAVGRGFGQGDMRQALKLGVTEREVDALCEAVMHALATAKEALDPEEIRQATGKASRSLGERGKTKGLTTTLPLALGRLQATGDIRRVPVNGRLDQQRYKYVAWAPSPLAKHRLDSTASLRELARRFFRWVGPATAAEFQWFAGLGVKAAREILEPLALVPAEAGSERLLLPEDVAAWKKFKAPTKPCFALVSSLDPITANRRDVRSFLDPKDHERTFPTEKSSAAGAAISDLPSHAVLDRGRIVGLWEFDAEAGELVAAVFGSRDKALDSAIARTEAFVRDELGDARSFSLDSPRSRVPKIAALRKLGR